MPQPQERSTPVPLALPQERHRFLKGTVFRWLQTGYRLQDRLAGKQARRAKRLASKDAPVSPRATACSVCNAVAAREMRCPACQSENLSNAASA